MAENIEPIPVSANTPSLPEIAPDLTLSGGVVDPLSKQPIKIDLPPPPTNYPVGVNPSNMIPTQGQVRNTSEIVQNMQTLAENASTVFRNPNHYGKVRAYNADYDGANFLRYASVPSVFKKYGFTPYRDNESLYNQEASWWDYFKRSVGQSSALAGTAFSSMLPWNVWDGKQMDMEAAKQMERAHAIGHDSRGGFGSFMNNLTVDSGFTFGILAEMAVEEIVGWAAATAVSPFTGGGSLAAKGARTGKNIEKAWNITETLSHLSDRYNKTYQWLRSSEKLKDIYKYGKSIPGKAISAVTPETFKFVKGLADQSLNVRQANNLISLANTSKGFGAFYRDVRAYNAIIAESKMEGGSTELQVRDHLIDQYYTKNGKAPDQEALERIYIQAANAGRETFYWNLPALWISNKIVFDKALKGFRPMNAFREELTKGIEGKLVFNEAWKKAGQQAWSVAEQGVGASMKRLITPSTYRPKNLLRHGLGSFVNYSKANLTEGLQEMYQDAVSNTMLEYYSDRFNHPFIEGSRSVWGVFADNLKKTTTSAEGWETFASGFLMGSMVQMPQKLAFEWLPTKFYALTDREGYKAYKENMQKRTNDVVNALNAATMDDKFWSSITENAVQHLNNNKQAYEANVAGDQKAYYDIVDEDVFNHLHTLLKTGKLGLIKDQIKDLKGLDEASLMEAYGPVEASEKGSYDEYQKNLTSMLNKAEAIEKWYAEVEDKFGQPFDPHSINKEKNPEAYQQELNSYIAWEEAKKTAIYSRYTFERTLSRMSSIMNDLKTNIPIGKSAAADYMMILNLDQLENEISFLEGNKARGILGEIEVKRKGDARSRDEADALQRKLDKLKEYRDAVEEYKLAAKIEALRASDPNAEEVKEADKGAKIVRGSKVRNKKGNIFTVHKKKGGFAYDKAGNRIGRIKDLESIDETKEKVVDVFSEATNNLKEKYHDFVKYLSIYRNTYAPNEGIDKAFDKLKDFYRLEQDSYKMADAIDMLHNPEMFMRYAKRMQNVVDQIISQKKEKIQASFEAFVNQKHKNDLFNALYEMGVFLDEEGMDAVSGNHMPSDFYDVTTKERIEEDSPKYKEIVDLFEKYEETSNIKFDEKPISEFEVTEDLLKYSSVNRNKINNDTRTFEQLAAQYGFDPNPGVTKKINTREILKKIITSPFATYREKALARRLLSVVSKDSVITFGKLSQPGIFKFSKEAKTGIFIDPRYTSHDYRGGKQHALEPLMMHEILHELTSQEMMNDPEFKKAVTKLFEEAKKAYEKQGAEDSTLFVDAQVRPFYGLQSEEEFVAELFNNDRFAAWLKTIPYETTGKTLWTEFADALRKFFKRILGISEDNTLLDEALYIVTSHIDRRGGQEATSTTTRATTPKGFLTTESSVDDLAMAGVLDALVQEYRSFVKETNQMTATGWEETTEDVAAKSNSDIAGSDAFRKFLKLDQASVLKILDEYNKKGEKPTAPKEEVKDGEAIPMANRETQKTLVEDYGYGWDEARKMTQKEADDIIAKGKSKAEISEEEKIIKEAEEAALKEEQEFFMQQVRDLINKAETIGEINDVLYRVAQSMMEDPLGIDTDLIDQIVEDRKRFLATNIKFEDIRENEVVIMKNGSKMIVTQKTKDTLYLRKKPGAKAYEVKADKVKEKILYRDQPYMEKLDINPPVSPEAQENANINNQTAQEMNSIESIAEDLNEAKTKSVEEIEDDFENSIGCE